MKINKYNSREEWMTDRKGRVTGSELKKLVPTGAITKAQLLEAAEKKGVEYKKSWTIAQLNGLFTPEELRAMELDAILKAEKLQGFYKLLADRLTVNDNEEETALDHGNRMESEAIEKFVEKTKLKVNTDLVIWERDDVRGIAISPDGQEDAEVVTFAVETKCLSSENHIKAILTDTIPPEFDYQKKQYFAVNDDLQTLYFVLYDNRFVEESLRLKIFEVKREEVQEDVYMLIKYQKAVLAEVDALVTKLTF